jgi:hypothetical protein
MESFKEYCAIQKAAEDAKLDISKYDDKEISMGFKAEKEEHGKGKLQVVKKDTDFLKIAVAHLEEDPKYYTKLKKIEH